MDGPRRRQFGLREQDDGLRMQMKMGRPQQKSWCGPQDRAGGGQEDGFGFDSVPASSEVMSVKIVLPSGCFCLMKTGQAHPVSFLLLQSITYIQCLAQRVGCAGSPVSTPPAFLYPSLILLTSFGGKKVTFHPLLGSMLPLQPRRLTNDLC